MDLKTFLCIFVSTLLCGLCAAGPAGKEFVLTFMQNYKYTGNPIRFMVEVSSPPSSLLSTKVKVTALGKVFETTLQPGSGQSFQLPEGVEVTGTTRTFQTVQVEADQDILVLSLSYKPYSADTSVVYPVQEWGTEYYVYTPQMGPADQYKEFAISNQGVPNTVEIQLNGMVTWEGQQYPRGSKLVFDLEPFESVQIQSQDDMTGSKVSAKQPVAVFTGHSCTWYFTGCNHVYEQLLPVSSWGKEFIVATLAYTKPSNRFDRVIIQASENTEIQITAQDGGASPNQMVAGETLYMNITYPNSLHFTTDKGVQVLYEFNGGINQNGETNDPFLITVLPTDRFSTSYTMESQVDFFNEAIIIAQAKDLGKLTLDNNPLPNDLQWIQAGKSEYSWAQINYAEGTGFHQVSHPDSPFALYSFGASTYNGYGSPAPGNPPATPKCPANSHFESCACPATCENPTPSAECKANCVEACTCDDGYLWSGNKCVPKNQCGCVYKSGSEKSYLQPGQSIWADDKCTKKCTCSPTSGQVVCENSSCSGGTECSVVSGIRACHPVHHATCNIYGDPHYKTFDNTTYDFQGTCTYIAAQGCHLDGTQLTPFAVIVENAKWTEIQASPNVSTAKVVIVQVYGMTLVLQRNQLYQIMVNEVLTNIPVILDNGKVTVQREGTQNIILTDFGLRVTFDMVYHVTITVPSSYAGKTCGLCGNFKGKKNDDLLLPDGKETKDVKTFGAAWKVFVPGVVCDDGCSADFCPKCPEDKKIAFEKDCSIITNPEGPFTACHSVINPESYFKHCVYDVCMGEGNKNMLCKDIAAYMTACQDAGVKIKNWRTPTFCPFTCAANSVYQICAKACDTPCPGLTEVMKCNNQICAEGCICKPGFFNNGTDCVTADQCSCYENGHTYKINETVITESCQERLTCLPNGKVSHETTECSSTEVCDVKNGVRGCYPKPSVTPTCPANSHFESCVCPATCENPTPSAECKANCVEACACDDGYLWSGNKCVLKTQCGCVYKSGGEEHYLQAGESIWADNNCTKNCTCSPTNGKIICENVHCPVGTACNINNGIRACQPLSQATCNIYGDPHYNTFDNSTYDFQGTCTYTAAQGCHLEGTQLTPFAVIVENEKWNEIQGILNVSMAKVVVVEVYGMILVLRRNQLHHIMVNGVLTNIPASLNGGEVIVQQEGYNNVIITNFGLRVAYDMVYHVSITVPSTYLGKTCGMCGNYNGNKNDDFLLPDGKETKDVKTFGAAWKVAVPGVVCDDGCSGDFCPLCSEDKKLVFEKDCSIITNPKGPFAACHSVINPESYFRDCVFDVCMSKGDQHMLCHSVTAYMTDCQDFKVPVNSWRTPTFCPLKCPDNSAYEICTTTCNTPCPGLTDIIKCNIQTCVEGYRCNPGFFSNGTGCVKEDQCSCYENGKTFKIGEVVVTEDCQEKLICQKSGLVKYESLKCKTDEVCQVENGVRGCYPKQCLLKAAGSFTLFNGTTWIIPSMGAYDLVEVCDDTVMGSWFRVVAVLQERSGVLSTAAIHIYFENVLVTVTWQNEIWFNGRKMTQPAMENNDVIVKVIDQTVFIEKTSAITLSYSLSQDLIITLNERIADKVCGACGKLTGSTPGESIMLYMEKYRAPDFPSGTL